MPDNEKMPGDIWSESIRRTIRIMIALSAAGAIAAALVRGPMFAVGFLIGAAISFVSFVRWHRIVSALGPGGRTGARTFLLALWPLGIAAILYVILKYSGINLRAVFFGLFVCAAAVSVEAIYQLYAGT